MHVVHIITGSRCHIISLLNIREDIKEETWYPECKETLELYDGRTNRKYMPFLMCTFLMQKMIRGRWESYEASGH
jgi:hypothetical protein